VVAPDWAFRNHTHVEPVTNGAHLGSRPRVGPKYKGIEWITDLVHNRYLSYEKLPLKLLGLSSFFRLLALGSVGRRR